MVLQTIGSDILKSILDNLKTIEARQRETQLAIAHLRCSFVKCHAFIIIEEGFRITMIQ
jgi:hypothetical protein